MTPARSILFHGIEILLGAHCCIHPLHSSQLASFTFHPSPEPVDNTIVEVSRDIGPLPVLFPDPEPTADSERSIPMTEESELEKWNKMIEEAERQVAEESTLEERLASGETYINEEGVETPLDEESKKKTYMTKNEQGQMEIKNR